MLDNAILEQLLKFSDEEIDALNGKNNLDTSIYEDDNTIDFNKILNQYDELGVRKHTRFMNYPKHKHNYIELIYVYNGSMTTHIDEETIVLNKGQFLLINQNIEHSVDYTGEDDIIFNFIIKKEILSFLSSIMEDNNKLHDFIFDSLYSYENIGEYLHFDLSLDETVTKYVEDIITHIYYPTLNNVLELKLLVGLLMCELMNHPENIKSYSKNSYDKVLLSTIYKYISMNSSKASLTELAGLLNMPDYKVSKVIKKLTGSTFMTLVKEERFRHAEQLLKTTDFSIETIINEVGYENESYFYRKFKEKYNMTPKAYKENSALH